MNGYEMVMRCHYYLNERWQWGWAVGLVVALRVTQNDFDTRNIRSIHFWGSSE